MMTVYYNSITALLLNDNVYINKFYDNPLRAFRNILKNKSAS